MMAWESGPLPLLLPLLLLATIIEATEAESELHWPYYGCYDFDYTNTIFFQIPPKDLAPLGCKNCMEHSVITPKDLAGISHELLKGSINNLTNNTPQECMKICNSTGYSFAGVQDGTKCVCSTEHPHSKGTYEDCNMPCSGDANQICGGSWKMSLYGDGEDTSPFQPPGTNETSRVSYMGCYSNTLDRLLSGTYDNSKTNSPVQCVDSCTEQGYAYAGLQYKTQCICANEEPHGAKQNETMCDYACPGDASAKCGGHWMMNVYQIAPAVNCTWTDWTWDSCSKSCGGGSQNGTRTVAQPAEHGGSECEGSTTASQTCNSQECPVNCTWSDWAWDSCSKSCGGGSQNGTRTVAQPAEHGGSECEGSTAASQTCNSQKCPVNCTWSDWTWDSCSKSCGVGNQNGTRTVAHPAEHGGSECEGSTTTTQSCNVHECPEGRLMVVPTNSYNRDTEFYSLDNTSLPECFQGTKTKLPHGGWNHGAFINPENGKPVICTKSYCSMYEVAIDKWETIGRQITSRDGRCGDYDPEVGLVIVGGMNGWTPTREAEISRDHGVTFEPLPNLPGSGSEGRGGSCLVIVDNSAFVTGGTQRHSRDKLNTVDELEIGADEWKPAPPMIQGRATHSCAAFTTSGGEKKIIVVGGSGASDGVELFSVNNREWRQASPIPVPINQHSMTKRVPLVVAGGLVEGGRMFKYHTDDDTWEELQTTLHNKANTGYLVHAMLTIEGCPKCNSAQWKPTIVSEENGRGRSDGRFTARATLVDNVDDGWDTITNKFNYWLGEPHQPAGFVIDRGCKAPIAEFQLRNSYNNPGWNNGGTKGFVIEIGDNAEGPWTKVIEDEFTDPRSPALPVESRPVEKISFPVNGTVDGQFIRFSCTSWYGQHAALQYIEWN